MRIKVEQRLYGEGVSAGIGIGCAYVVKPQPDMAEPLSAAPLSCEEELSRLEDALEEFSRRTRREAEHLRKRAGEKEAEILAAHGALAADSYARSRAKQLIEAGMSASHALDQVWSEYRDMLAGAEDELTRQRSADAEDIRVRLHAILSGTPEHEDLAALPLQTVLIVQELTPSMASSLRPEAIAAVLCQRGGRTSHGAILARALGIPAIMGIAGILDTVPGAGVICDGESGLVILNPEPETYREYTCRKDAFQQEQKELEIFRARATRTADEKQLSVLCNVGAGEEWKTVTELGGEGIGLFRTEFLFLDRKEAPDEELQFRQFSQAARSLKRDMPLCIRTMDIGGDKQIPYLGLEKEENPFLGYRGIRYSLDHSELFCAQLRAILRTAALREAQVQLLVPMVTDVSQIRRVRELVELCQDELWERRGRSKQAALSDPAPSVPIGVMIETPASVFIAKELAAEAEFFSIGTNDLTQYIMAADRGNSRVADLYTHLALPVIRAVQTAAAAAASAGIPCHICGEAGADPLFLPLLLAFGVDEISVSPAAVAGVRRNISLWKIPEAQKVAELVLEMEDRNQVRQFLENLWEKKRTMQLCEI